MFQALIAPIFRNNRLWYNTSTMLPAGRPATSWVYYTTSCNTQSVAPEDERDQRLKHVELIELLINRYFCI